MEKVIEQLLSSDELKLRIMANAKKFYNIEKRDLYQAGYYGALKALKKYDFNSNIQFTTYANMYIFGEMYKFAQNNRNIKVDKTYLKIYKQIENAKSLLTQKFNREPSLEEVSMFLEMDISLINDVIITCSTIISLDEESECLNDSNLYAITGTNYDYDTKLLIRDSREELNDMERKVIVFRYFKEYTQQETAEEMGINQVKVSRLESSSKRKIKEYICA